MAMGTREKLNQQESLWVAATELPRTAGHPFYARLNQMLEVHGFDSFVESRCARYYAERMGRPSLTPGRYFRCLLVGYFEENRGRKTGDGKPGTKTGDSLTFAKTGDSLTFAGFSP